MSTDLLIATTDPLHAGDDPDLDPRGAMAARVRATALQGDRPLESPRLKGSVPMSRGRSWGQTPRWVAGGAAAVALAVGVVVIGGGSPATAPPDARAALITAAERTALFTSGQITWHMTFDDPKSIYDVEATNVVRYEGDAVDVDSVTREHGVSGNPEETVHRGGYRSVGGRAFVRSDDRWQETAAAPAGERGASAQFRDQLDSAEALAQVARGAADVSQTPVEDGGTRFTATIDAADVPQAFDRRWTGPVSLQTTVGGDGVVRSLTLSAGPDAIAVTFADLGAPQQILAP